VNIRPPQVVAPGTRCPWGLIPVLPVARPQGSGSLIRDLPVTQTDSANERPLVQEDSQSKECDANHNPDHSCVGENQDCETDPYGDYLESSHGSLLKKSTTSASPHDGERGHSTPDSRRLSPTNCFYLM
jgi:hypothetical protein